MRLGLRGVGWIGLRVLGVDTGFRCGFSGFVGCCFGLLVVWVFLSFRVLRGVGIIYL